MPTTKTKAASKKVIKKSVVNPQPAAMEYTEVPFAAASPTWYHEDQEALAHVEPSRIPEDREDSRTNFDQEASVVPRARSSWRCLLTTGAIFLFPFIVLPWTTSLHEFPKQTFLALLVGVGLLITLLSLRRSDRFDLLPRHLILPIGFIALIVMILGIVRSQFPYLFFFGSGGSEGASWFTLFLLSVWILLAFHAGRESVKLPYLALLWSGSMLSLITLLSLSGVNLYGLLVATPGFNPASTTTIASLLAAGALILGMGFFAQAPHKSMARWYGLLLCIPPAVLLLGVGFRVAWIVAAVGLGTLTLLRVKAKRVVSPVILVTLAVALILAVKPFISFLKTPIEVGPSYGETMSIAKAALADHALLGTGAASFSHEYLRFRSLPILQTPFWNLAFDWGYSGVLTFLVHHGLFGLGLLLIAVVSVLLTGFRRALQAKEEAGHLPALTATGLALFVGAFLAPTTLALSFFLATLLGLILGSTVMSWQRMSRSVQSVCRAGMIILACGVLLIQGARAASEAVVSTGVRAAASDLTRGEQRILLGSRIDQLNDGTLRALSEVRRLRLRALLSQPAPQEDQQAALQRLRDLADSMLSAARRAANLSPGAAVNWATLGNAYLDIASFTQGAAGAATEAFEKASALSPSDPSLLVNLGVARALAAQAVEGEEGTRLNGSAEEALREASKLRPGFPFAHLELARFYGQKKEIDKALAAYRNVEVLLPKDPALRYEVGLFLFGNDKQDEAARELEAAIELASNFSNARWYLAQIYEEQDQLEKAVEQIKKVIELNPQNEQAKTRLEELNKKAK